MYEIQCLSCKSKCWVSGSYDSETNATELKDKEILFEDYEGDCQHEEFEVIDFEYPARLEDDVI